MYVCLCACVGDRWGGGTIGVRRRVCTFVCVCEEKKGCERRGLLTRGLLINRYLNIRWRLQHSMNEEV